MHFYSKYTIIILQVQFPSKSNFELGGISNDEEEACSCPGNGHDRQPGSDRLRQRQRFRLRLRLWRWLQHPRACGEDHPGPGHRRHHWYLLWCRLRHDERPEPLLTLTELNVTSTGASKDNVEGITDDEYGLAILQSDVLTYAHEGTNVFTAPETDALWVAYLYNETVQITAKGGITSVDQLKGKAVCVGDQGSGTEFNAYQVLEAYGMTADDIEVVHANFGEASEMLKNGQIDAAFTVVSAPTTAITELATSGMDFSLVSLDQEHVDALHEKYPFLVQENLPA